MKSTIKLLLAAFAAPTAFFPTARYPLHIAAQDNSVEISFHDVADLRNKRSNLHCYVGSNARWFVDRESGVISALSLDALSPLWSKDGVVFRAVPSTNYPITEAASPSSADVSPAMELAGRVYFILDIPPHKEQNGFSVRRDALLVALDAKAQGRLVWKLKVRDFAPFFSQNLRGELRFTSKIQAATNDKILVQVLSDREVKRFAIDAATGETRLLESRAISK